MLPYVTLLLRDSYGFVLNCEQFVSQGVSRLQRHFQAKVKNVGQSLEEIINKILFICGAHHHTTLILNERVVLCFVDREVCVKPSALRGKPPTPGSQAPTMAVFIFYIC